jgi:ferredoxin
MHIMVREPMAKVTFIYGDQTKEVETENGKTLLQVGLDNSVPIEHACGGNGFCTTCMCHVKDGMENLSDRNDREENMGVVNDPERLTCQAEVQGDCTVELQDL